MLISRYFYGFGTKGPITKGLITKGLNNKRPNETEGLKTKGLNNTRPNETKGLKKVLFFEILEQARGQSVAARAV